MIIHDWDQNCTEREYPKGSLMIYFSTGEEAGVIIICTPEPNFFLEEIPLYGGMPKFYGEFSSIQQCLKVIKEELI